MAYGEVGAITRERILDAALAIASTEGLSALTTRRVAQKAGVNVGLLHYHFGSKEKLLEETLRRFGEEMRLLFERMFVEHAHEAPEEKLVAMLVSAFETARLRPGLVFGFLARIATALADGALPKDDGGGLLLPELPTVVILRSILEERIFPLLALHLGDDQELVKRRAFQVMTSIFHPLLFATQVVPFFGIDLSTREGRVGYVRSVVKDALAR